MAMPVDAKLLRTTKFPPQFNQKVDMQKVNVDVMKKYAPRVGPSEVHGADGCTDGSLERSPNCLVMRTTW